MGLPWVRLDSNIASHDKILLLLDDPSPKKWQAIASYVFSFGYAGGHATDGFIPKVALPAVHGTSVTARLLEKYELWDTALTGWNIRNYADRQESSNASEIKRKAQSLGGKKSQCKQHHPAGCECWKAAS